MRVPIGEQTLIFELSSQLLHYFRICLLHLTRHLRPRLQYTTVHSQSKLMPEQKLVLRSGIELSHLSLNRERGHSYTTEEAILYQKPLYPRLLL